MNFRNEKSFMPEYFMGNDRAYFKTFKELDKAHSHLSEIKAALMEITPAPFRVFQDDCGWTLPTDLYSVISEDQKLYLIGMEKSQAVKLKALFDLIRKIK